MKFVLKGGDTCIVGVIRKSPSSGSFLNFVYLVNIFFGIRVPDSRGVFKLGSDYGFIASCNVSYPRRG